MAYECGGDQTSAPEPKNYLLAPSICSDLETSSKGPIMRVSKDLIIMLGLKNRIELQGADGGECSASCVSFMY